MRPFIDPTEIIVKRHCCEGVASTNLETLPDAWCLDCEQFVTLTEEQCSTATNAVRFALKPSGDG